MKQKHTLNNAIRFRFEGHTFSLFGGFGPSNTKMLYVHTPSGLNYLRTVDFEHINITQLPEEN